MKRLPIPVFLLSLLLIMAACSMPYIADIPEWMTGDWDIFSESGEYIGRCEIDTWSIDITIASYGSYEQFDLLSQAMQNGGWSEANENTYTLYADISNTDYIEFKRIDEGNIRIDIIQSNITEATLTLKNS